MFTELLIAALLWSAPAWGGAWEATVERLPHSGRLVVVEDHRVPVVRVELGFPVGSHSAWWQGYNLDHHWALLVHGLEDKHHEGSLQVVAWTSPRTCGLTAVMLSSEVESATEFLRRRLDSEFAGGRLADEAQLRRWYKGRKESPSFLLQRAVARTMYRRGDTRRERLERPDGVEILGTDLERIRGSILDMTGWSVGFAGDITLAEARDAARMILGHRFYEERTSRSWDAAVERLVPPDDRPRVLEVRARSSAATLVAWTRSGVAIEDPRSATALLASEVVRRRLQRALRDERGETYGVWTEGMVYEVAGAYVLGTSLDPERAEGRIAFVEAELERLHTEGVTEAEVERAQALAGSEVISEVHAPWQAMELEVHRILHRDATQRHHLLHRATKLGHAEVDAFVRDFYRPSEFTRVMVGPRLP